MTTYGFLWDEIVLPKDVAEIDWDKPLPTKTCDNALEVESAQ